MLLERKAWTIEGDACGVLVTPRPYHDISAVGSGVLEQCFS